MKQIWTGILLFMFHFLGLRSEELKWNTQIENVNVSLSIASSSLSVQESLSIQADISYPSSYSVSLDPFTQSFHFIQSNWSLIKQDREVFQLENRKTLHLEAILAPLKEGDLLFSLFDIHFSHASESSHIIWTPIFTIHVNPAADQSPIVAPVLPVAPQHQVGLTLANRQALYDSAALNQEAIYVQQRLAMQSFPWLFVLFVLLGSMGWFLWSYFRRSSLSIAIPRQSPSQEALKTLQKIHQQNWLQQGLYQNYFLALTNLLRRYLERTFKLPVSVKTTDEFLSYLESQPHFSLDSKRFLHQFFVQADQVKFAKHLPSLQECEEASNQLQQFIQKN